MLFRSVDGSDHTDDEIFLSESMAKTANIKTEKTSISSFAGVIRCGGQIIYPQGEEYTISATTTGIIAFGPQMLTDGKTINKGETLFFISSKTVEGGDQNLKTKLNYETALKEYKRAQDLVIDLIISQREFEQIKLKYESAKADYDIIKNNITPNGIKIKSPTNGYLTKIFVSQGEYVTTGQAIASVSKNNKLLLRAEVPEKYYAGLKNINTANFKMNYSNEVYQLKNMHGRLLSFGRSATDNSFYIPVIFEFVNNENIVPGSYAEVFLLTKTSSEIITIPISSLTEEQGLYFVYLKTGKESYIKREVTTGESNGERIEIKSGLTVGEEVVTNGVSQIRLAGSSSTLPEGHSH